MNKQQYAYIKACLGEGLIQGINIHILRNQNSVNFHRRGIPSLFTRKRMNNTNQDLIKWDKDSSSVIMMLKLQS